MVVILLLNSFTTAEPSFAKSHSGPHVPPRVTLYDYSYDGIEKDSAIVSLIHHTYYQTTLSYYVYNLTRGTSVQFQNVTFAFPEGTMNTPGGSFIMLDIKFPDGSEEIYGHHEENPGGSGSVSGIRVPTTTGPSNAKYSVTVLSNHVMPQAGLTIYHDKIKLLVSTYNQTSTGSLKSTLRMVLFSSLYTGVFNYERISDAVSVKGLLTDALGKGLADREILIYVKLSENRIFMGKARTDSEGCFYFNSWDSAKLKPLIDKYGGFRFKILVVFPGDSDYRRSFAYKWDWMYSGAVSFPAPSFRIFAKDTIVSAGGSVDVTAVVHVEPSEELLNLTLSLDALPCKGVSVFVTPSVIPKLMAELSYTGDVTMSIYDNKTGTIVTKKYNTAAGNVTIHISTDSNVQLGYYKLIIVGEAIKKDLQTGDQKHMKQVLGILALTINPQSIKPKPLIDHASILLDHSPNLYKSGENMTITAQIFDKKNSAIPNNTAEVKVWSADNRDIVFQDVKLVSDSNGIVRYTFKIPEDAKSGIYYVTLFDSGPRYITDMQFLLNIMPP